MTETATTVALRDDRDPRPFTLEPETDARAALAADLGVLGIRKLRFEGQLTPEGRSDWRLDARLGATVLQSCVVTLQPVTTRIDEDVVRRYVADLPEPEGDEVEMPEDDTIEPLPRSLDLAAVMAEALAIALPDFPRAEGVELGEAVFAAPGVAPLRDEDAKPFAGLADLKNRMDDGSEG